MDEMGGGRRKKRRDGLGSLRQGVRTDEDAGKLQRACVAGRRRGQGGEGRNGKMGGVFERSAS